MADNYLEKRMDDYRSGRLSVRRRAGMSPRAVAGRAGDMVVPFPPMRILVVSGSLSPLAAEIVRQARDLGISVALMSAARREATSLSQSAGARLCLSMSYDAVFADLDRHWGGVDVVLADEGVDDPERDGIRLLRLRPADAPVEALARFYIFMAHPDNSFSSCHK